MKSGAVSSMVILRPDNGLWNQSRRLQCQFHEKCNTSFGDKKKGPNHLASLHGTTSNVTSCIKSGLSSSVVHMNWLCTNLLSIMHC